MYHATNSRNRSSLRDTRPISVLVGASADALWVEVFLAAARALARFLIALNDVFDPLRDGLVIVRPVRLAVCCPRKEDSARSLLFPPDRFYFLAALTQTMRSVRVIAAI
jgi:hypothetical protein